MTDRKKPVKCCRWVTLAWSEAAETWMLDMRFQTAPPENQWAHFGFGHAELKELHQAIGRALRDGKKRRADKAIACVATASGEK